MQDLGLKERLACLINNAYVTIRYNIVALPGLEESYRGNTYIIDMNVTYEDSGVETRVIMKLIEKPLDGGS